MRFEVLMRRKQTLNISIVTIVTIQVIIIQVIKDFTFNDLIPSQNVLFKYFSLLVHELYIRATSSYVANSPYIQPNVFVLKLLHITSCKYSN